MTSFKKLLSVLMAAVMLLGVLSVGMIGLAADFNLNAQYSLLADALKNEYVADLTNYTLTNPTLNNGADGFDADANGFAYEHRVTAKDNSNGDILKAANRFYCIFENIMSTKYGEGLYDPGMIHSTVTARLKTYFDGADETYYEDFYGKRYYPTEEEIKNYNDTVSLLEAADREITPAVLTGFRIYFMEKDYYSFFNVDTIIQYFLGNTLKINAGNWYHRYLFIVETSLDTWLTEAGDINNLSEDTINVRKAVYELDYDRTFNETQTKAFYAFRQPELETVWQHYADEFGFDNASSDLTATVTKGGQAAAFMIKAEADQTTIPYLRIAYGYFQPYIEKTVDANGNTWDYTFSKMDEDQLAHVGSDEPSLDTRINEMGISGDDKTAIQGMFGEDNGTSSMIVSLMDDLSSRFSNDALMSMFGKKIGNMITLAYILKPMSSLPERTVRGEAKYTVTTTKLNGIVNKIDNLIYNSNDDTSKRVATIVKQFFNTNSDLFKGTQVEGLEYETLKDLVPLLLQGLLFRDSIINKLVGMIYPMLCDLIKNKLLDKIGDAVGSVIEGWTGDLLSYILKNNDLAIYPNQLGDRIAGNYPNGKFSDAVAVLRAAGDNWNNVNMEALNWGVDDAPLGTKGTAFIDGFCAAFSGFRLLLITVMCGDDEYKNSRRKKGGSDGLTWLEDNDDNQFTEYYDKLLVNIGQKGVTLRSQGVYTKLIIPLMRVLGLTEQATYNNSCYGYLTSQEYHRMVDVHGDNCLRLILEPIVYWATEVLSARPFETLWKMLPNLVYFFVRQGNGTMNDNWGGSGDLDDTHKNYSTCQTYSISEVLNHVYLNVKYDGLLVHEVIYGSSISGFLGDKASMLTSLNGLLNEVLDLSYIKGPAGEMLPCAYTNGTDIVLKDSVEYVSNPSAYPTELLYCYSNANETSFTFEEDDDHPVRIDNPKYDTAPYKLPQIQEKKITSTTTETNGVLADPNAIGVLNTAWNTIDVRNPGVVLLYVLRFVISALGYRYDINEGAEDQELPMLIECFGLDIDKVLFQGLNLKDIIYNVMLHPDEAICALLELFYSNEQGDKYNSVPYTYSLNEINYHNSVLLNKTINPTLTYGTAVRYTQYWTREYARDTIADSGELVQNILLMLGKDEFKDGFGPYLANLLNDKVFNDGIVNKVFNLVYKLLGGLNDKVGFQIDAILKAALNVTYDPSSIGKTVEAILGYPTPASTALKKATAWTDVFTTTTETDVISGKEITTVNDVDFDWGVTNAAAHNTTNHDAFLRVMSALLSPAAFAFKYLFMDQNLNILGLVELDAYAGYHYAWIGLLEALSCPNVLSYRDYYERANATAPGTKIGDANAIYYMLAPLGGLIDKIYEDPITNVLNLIPNLMFFISIGGLNDLLNNLVHFAYVLLDIIKPIINGYDLLDGLLSNIDIKGYTLNLTLPLNIDFNALISDLIGVLVGDSLNLGGLQLTLPYIDFHTLCCGQLKSYNSSEERSTVKLDSAEGADLLTAALRLVFEVIFMDENKEAVTNFIVDKVGVDENGNPKLDSYDKRTLLQVINQLYTLMETYEVPDMLLFVVYQLVTKLTPVSSKLAPALAASGMTITDLFSNISDPKAFIASLTNVLNNMGIGGQTTDPDGTIPTPAAAGNLFDRLRAFFEKIIEFFKRLFGG